MAGTITADVVVYGSTPAGITAAVQAKRMGRSVVLISQRRRIGGMTTGGLSQVDIGNKSAYSGLALQFFRDVKAHYDWPGSWTRQAKESYKPEVWDIKSPTNGYEDTMWTFEPHVAEAILEKWIADAGVTLVRGEWLDRGAGGVVKKGCRIVSIRTLDGAWRPTGKAYAGKVFLDCSYEGDLMAAAGVSYVVGRESNGTYGETLNGYQPKQANHELVAGIDPYVTKGDATSGLLPGIRARATVEDRETGSGDSFVQSYNYRLCLTTNQDNRIRFTAPPGYDTSRYELLFRAIAAGDDMTHKNECPMPNGKTDTNNDGGVSTDYIGMSWEYPEAAYARRAEIALDHLRYVQGLFYTLANDPRVPAETRALYSDHGVCSDEFTDSPYGTGWSDELYIRESRRMVGAYVMTERNIRGTAVAPKEIARGSYGIDSHAVQRYVGADGCVHNEGNIQWQTNLLQGATYPIGYGAVTPKRSECENLLVAFCLSASHCAFGSIRMEPVLFELGQACGAAAAIAVEDACAVQDVPYAALRVRKYDTHPPRKSQRGRAL